MQVSAELRMVTRDMEEAVGMRRCRPTVCTTDDYPLEAGDTTLEPVEGVLRPLHHTVHRRGIPQGEREPVGGDDPLLDLLHEVQVIG
jgi:hypothetical protein